MNNATPTQGQQFNAILTMKKQQHSNKEQIMLLVDKEFEKETINNKSKNFMKMFEDIKAGKIKINKNTHNVGITHEGDLLYKFRNCKKRERVWIIGFPFDDQMFYISRKGRVAMTGDDTKLP